MLVPTLVILVHSQPIGLPSSTSSSSSSSIRSSRGEAERDPLVALASDYHSGVEAKQASQPQVQQEVIYVYHPKSSQQQPASNEHEAAAGQAPSSSGAKQNNVEYRTVVEPAAYQYAPEVAVHHPQRQQVEEHHYAAPQEGGEEVSRVVTYVHQVEQPQQQPQEVVQLKPETQIGSTEYPGEVIYVGSNGEQIGGNSQQDSSRTLREAVSSISEVSGMPATILTEVPVKDMPYEGK